MFLGARFLGQGVKKRQFLDTPSKKKRKFWLITEKLFFWYFCVFYFFFLGFSFFCFFLLFFWFCFVFFCFFWGFKGQVRWPEGPPHLALNPPYLFFLVLFLFLFCFVFCLFFLGGFKGQVRWPEGPPHLALNPPYFFIVWFCFCFLFSFPFFASNRQKTLFFPLEKGIFCLFSMFLFLSPLTFFGLPLFLFLFLCLSLSLVFLSSFLSFFLLSFCFLFLSLFHFSFFFAFVSWKEQHENFQLQFIFSWNISLSFGFLSCFFFPIPFSYLCFFLILSYVFCSTSMFLVSKKQSWKTPIFGQKGSCNKTVFFYEPVFWKMWKVIVFFAHFFAKFWLMFKKHYKIGISAHF